MADKDIETGVTAALKAYKIETGMPDAAAQAWAVANAAEGADLWTASYTPLRYTDPELGREQAFADLRAWALLP